MKMSQKSRPKVETVLLVALCIATSTVRPQTIPGIPEPGLIMYGSVTNVNGNYPLISAETLWSLSGGGSSVTLTSTVVNVNGQYFHITRVPFETRTVSGQTFTPTANTLPLVNGITFNRAATVKGQSATIISSSAFPAPFGSFQLSPNGPGSRGLIERIDLSVNLPGIAFQDWLGLYPSLPGNQRGQNDDPDGDGVTNYAEYRAGTDPTRANSSFRFIDIRPSLSGGIDISWSSANGKAYSVERSPDPGSGFAILQSNIAATPGTNTLHDATATGFGPYFYRLTVE